MIALLMLAALDLSNPTVAGLTADQATASCRTMAGQNLQTGEAMETSVNRLVTWTRQKGMDDDQTRELLIFCAGWSFGFGDGVRLTAQALGPEE